MEDGYLGIGKHCRKWILFGHAKVVLPSQTENITRNKDWMLSSHVLLDGAQISWRAMIWEYIRCGKISAH